MQTLNKQNICGLVLHLKLRFVDFKIGQTFEKHVAISSDESDKYLSFSKTRMILLENRELAKMEGITGSFLSGRSIISRVEGEMTRLDAFSDKCHDAIWDGWRSFLGIQTD